MASKEEIVERVLKFTDQEFFASSQTALASRGSQLLDLDFQGLAVNAPRRIWTDRHDKLPLFLAARYSGDRDWDVPLADNCILIGANLNNGTVKFADALLSEKEIKGRGRAPKAPRGPKPPGLALKAAQVTELDARGRLLLEWDTGSWALGVLYYDWPSNMALVDIIGAGAPPPAEVPPVYPLPNLAGGGAMPAYVKVARTPGFPAAGATFSVNYHVVAGSQTLDVFGSFVVSVRDFHIPRERIVDRFQDGQEKIVAAIVPVTFALLAPGWELPWQFDWAVPVYGEPLSAGAPAGGMFALNVLATAPNPPLPAGHYASYLVVDGAIAGPQAFQVPSPGR